MSREFTPGMLGDSAFTVQFNAETLWPFKQLCYPRVPIVTIVESSSISPLLLVV